MKSASCARVFLYLLLISLLVTSIPSVQATPSVQQTDTLPLFDGAPEAAAITSDALREAKNILRRTYSEDLTQAEVAHHLETLMRAEGADAALAFPTLVMSGDELMAALVELNEDPACTGYIVQLPLPKHLDEGAALEAIDPAKDADGLHPMNLGRLVLGIEAPLPCTPRGVVELLTRHGLEVNGQRVCIVGRGVTVGRPLGLLLTRRSENATVTLCHTGTKDLASHTREADIVVSAAGRPGLITADMLTPGAVVLDVGITRTDAGLVGDLAPDVADVASWMAPMPGGVGPMTRAMLLANVVEAAERAAGL